MRITVVAVGRLKEPGLAEAAAEYVKRLGRYADLEVTEVPDHELSHGAEEAVRREGDALLAAWPLHACVVALDARGHAQTSEEFAAWLEELMVGGVSRVGFVIGGSAGLDERVLKRSNQRLALSRMTLPHQLARVVVLEQLYRAFRIMRGEPYHL